MKSLVLYFLLGYCTFSSLSCPDRCNCTADIADCSSQNFTRIPSREIPRTITELLLSNNSISEVLEELNRFQNLEVLDLSHNNVSNFLRRVFENVSLRELILDYNNLDFNENQVNKQREFFKGNIIYSLMHLSARHNQFSGELHENLFYELDYLTYLDFSYNNFSYLAEQPFPSQLQHLDLSYNSFTNINNNSFDFLFELEYLDLRGLKMTSLAGNLFQHLESLKELKIGGSQLQNVSNNLLTGLAKLVKLDIVESNISFLAVDLLLPCKLLEQLNLSYNQLTSIQTNFLIYVPHLRILDLSENNLVTIESQAQLSFLTILFLDSNLIKEIPSGIRQFPQIKTLSLSNNNLNDINYTVSSLSLAYLNLTGCRISQIQSNAFQNCPSLQFINLTSNTLKALPLLNTTNKLEIFLDDNQLDCNCDLYKTYSAFPNDTFSSSTSYKCNDDTLDCLICRSPVRVAGMPIDEVFDDEHKPCFEGHSGSSTTIDLTKVIIIIVAGLVILVFVLILILYLAKKRRNTKNTTIHDDSPRLATIASNGSVLYDTIEYKSDKTKPCENRDTSNTEALSDDINKRSNPLYYTINPAAEDQNTEYVFANDVIPRNSESVTTTLTLDEGNYLLPVQSPNPDSPGTSVTTFADGEVISSEFEHPSGEFNIYENMNEASNESKVPDYVSMK